MPKGAIVSFLATEAPTDEDKEDTDDQLTNQLAGFNLDHARDDPMMLEASIHGFEPCTWADTPAPSVEGTNMGGHILDPVGPLFFDPTGLCTPSNGNIATPNLIHTHGLLTGTPCALMMM